MYTYIQPEHKSTEEKMVEKSHIKIILKMHNTANGRTENIRLLNDITANA